MSVVGTAVRRPVNLRKASMPGLAAVVLLAVWQLVGLVVDDSQGVPTVSDVVGQFGSDGWAFYWNNLEATMGPALLGYLLGSGAAVVVAVALVVSRSTLLERVVGQLALATYALPLVAIGPILQVVLDGSQPKIALAVLSVFFLTLVGALLGLASADPLVLDAVLAFGGGRWAQFTKVRLRAALPQLFAALQIGAPAAVLGSVIAEYMGAEKGLGVAMVASQESLQVERTWALAVTITLCAGAMYLIVGMIARRAVPRLSGGTYGSLS